MACGTWKGQRFCFLLEQDVRGEFCHFLDKGHRLVFVLVLVVFSIHAHR